LGPNGPPGRGCRRLPAPAHESSWVLNGCAYRRRTRAVPARECRRLPASAHESSWVSSGIA